MAPLEGMLCHQKTYCQSVMDEESARKCNGAAGQVGVERTREDKAGLQ